MATSTCARAWAGRWKVDGEREHAGRVFEDMIIFGTSVPETLPGARATYERST